MPTYSYDSVVLAKGDKVKITLANGKRPIHGTVSQILNVNGADEVCITTPRGNLSVRVIGTPRRTGR